MKTLIFFLLFSVYSYAQLPTMVIDTSKTNGPGGVYVTTNIQLYMMRYWNENTQSMKNIYSSTLPKKVTDIFGLPHTIQIKYYPYNNPYIIPNIPPNMVDWVYIEMKDANTGAIYCIPAWLNENGVVMDILNQNSRARIMVRPNTRYLLKIHTTSFSLLANTEFEVQSIQSTVEWNFKLGDNYIVPNNFGLPSPLISLEGSQFYGIKFGDTWSLFNPTRFSKLQLSADNIADLADMASINNDYIFLQHLTNTWFQTDMNQDGKVTLDDYWEVWREDIFLSCSGAGEI